jgi:hypothetical protein
MLQLLAAPEKFVGRRVEVVGYLNIEFEGTALYVHREDFEQDIYKNAFWIDVPDRWLETPRGYVIVEARVDASNHGHRGLFSGALSDVTRLERWGRLTGR